MTETNIREKRPARNSFLLQRARMQSKKMRQTRYVTVHTKIMGIVLAVAFVASAVTAVVVSAFKDSAKHEAHTTVITEQISESHVNNTSAK